MRIRFFGGYILPTLVFVCFIGIASIPMFLDPWESYRNQMQEITITRFDGSKISFTGKLLYLCLPFDGPTSYVKVVDYAGSLNTIPVWDPIVIYELPNQKIIAVNFYPTTKEESWGIWFRVWGSWNSIDEIAFPVTKTNAEKYLWIAALKDWAKQDSKFAKLATHFDTRIK